MQCYCDFCVLTFLLINDINKCLPRIQLELLHAELLEWCEDCSSFLNQMISAKQFLCQIQSQAMSPDNSNILYWLYTLVKKVAYFFCVEAHLWSHNPQEANFSESSANFLLLFKKTQIVYYILFHNLIFLQWKLHNCHSNSMKVFLHLSWYNIEVNIILCNNGKCFNGKITSNKYIFMFALFQHI